MGGFPEPGDGSPSSVFIRDFFGPWTQATWLIRLQEGAGFTVAGQRRDLTDFADSMAPVCCDGQ
jgi:hypothetical protein